MKPRLAPVDEYRRRLMTAAGGAAALSIPAGALAQAAGAVTQALGGTAELGFAELPDGALAEQAL
jgi:hypothetical protein